MEIVKIQEIDGIYFVESKPSRLGRIFGVKSDISKYKQIEYTYKYCDTVQTYIDDSGDILAYDSQVVMSIENWKRKF